MLSVERRNHILNVLKQEGRVVAQTLSDDLQVSIDTIRRDLRDLAASGQLQRVHGGALPVSPASTSYSYRQQNLTPAKISIAARAAQLVADGMVVAIGGGTTNVQTVQHFPRDLRATIITHNPPVALALSDFPNIEVVLVGGRLFKYTMVTIGAETVAAFGRVRADLCFLGVLSLHPEVGVTNIHYEETEVQRAMVACAAEVVALASSEKFGTAAPFVIGPLSDLNVIVTDSGIDEATLKPYRDFEIEIIQVEGS